MQGVDALREPFALAGGDRLRCRGQQITEVVKTTAIEHLHLVQITPRHILGHLAERPPLALAIFGALHPYHSDFTGRIEPGRIGVRCPVKKYVARGERVEPRQDPSRDLEFAPRKPTPESLELGGVETVGVVEDSEGTEL